LRADYVKTIITMIRIITMIFEHFVDEVP